MTKQFCVKLSPTSRQTIERIVGNLAVTGVQVSRAVVIRMAVERGLAALSAPEAGTEAGS